MRNVKKHITEYPLLIIFFALSVLMLAGYIFMPQKEYSEMENRYLQLRPAVTGAGLLDGSFMERFETYTNEQIPLRSVLVKCKAFLVQLSGASENDGIAMGDDGYLFDKTLSVSDKLYKNTKAIENFAGTVGRDIYVAIAPTSVWVNHDKLPAGMPVLDEELCSKELAAALSGIDSAHIIDLYDILKKHSDEQLYYRTDHHWTTKGAGYAYRKIAEEMGLEVLDIGRYEKHEAGDFRGTHYAKYKGLVTADTIEYYDVPIDELILPDRTVKDLTDKDKLAGFDKYASFMYGNGGKYVVNADKGAGRNLIIFKDSYANCLIPYLVMNYDKITVIDLRYFGGAVADELAEDAEADVLLMYNWTFVNDDNHFYKLSL